MHSVWESGVFVLLWRFLGAEFISSDLELALHAHTAARQFYNWGFHMATCAKTWTHSPGLLFKAFPAHQCLTTRLQGALDLLVLRGVSKIFRQCCDLVLDLTRVHINDLLIVCQDAETFRNYVMTRTTFSVNLRFWLRELGQDPSEDAEFRALVKCTQSMCDLQTAMDLRIATYEPTPTLKGSTSFDSGCQAGRGVVKWWPEGR